MSVIIILSPFTLMCSKQLHLQDIHKNSSSRVTLPFNRKSIYKLITYFLAAFTKFMTHFRVIIATLPIVKL